MLVVTGKAGVHTFVDAKAREEIRIPAAAPEPDEEVERKNPSSFPGR
jgi:hypothetical protein